MALSKFIKEAKLYSGKISLFHIIILSCFFALISIINQHGGTLHMETEVRLPFYLSDIPLVNKLFDSQIIEVDRFRARELSYVLDFIDSKFIELGIENGFPHFLSLTHYLFSIATGCLLWLFCVKELNLKPLTGIGLLMLFWTSPSIFLGGSYFRAAKIGVALLSVILFYVIYKAAVISEKKTDSEISKKLWLVYGAAVFLITFLDEQGLYFAFAVVVFLSIWGLIYRNRNIVIMLLTGIAGVFLHVLYRYILAPQLTFILNGYRPSFDYQTLSIQTFIKNMDYYISAGFFLYLETFRFLIGTPPRIAAIGFLLLFIIVPACHLYTRPGLPDDNKKFFRLAFVELLMLNFLLIIMNALMFFRNPLIVWPNITRTYYFLPMNVVFAMTLAVLADIFQKSNIKKWLVSIMICLAIIGNIAALPKHNDIIRQGQESSIGRSSDLLDALKNIDTLDNVKDPVVRQNLVFKFFKSQKDIPPGGSDEYHKKGIYDAERGRYRQAVDSFSKAIIQNPDNIQFRLSRAYICFKLGNYQQSIDDLNEVILRKPDYTEAYSNRGIAYINQGNKETGCRDAQKACALGNCSLLEKTKSQGICVSATR
jgi:tetratricopeptide (TPR) repeat protein